VGRFEAAGHRVVRESVRVGGVAVDPRGTYRVAMNNFLAEGGDGFAVFTEGIDRVGGPLDAEALAATSAGEGCARRPRRGVSRAWTASTG
jgi:5'-nucleotidase